MFLSEYHLAITNSGMMGYTTMAKKLFSLIAVFGLASTLLVQSMATVNAQEPVSSNQPNPRLVESSDQGLVLELSVPKFQFNQLFSDIGPCQQINLEGWGVIGDAGEPSLPVKGTLVGLPIGSGLNAEVIDIGPALVLEEDQSITLPLHRQNLIIPKISQITSANN